MMRNENDLRRALQGALEPLSLSQLDEQRLLFAMKERKPMMKKRWMPVLAFALILMLSLTALAVSNWESVRDYLNTVRGMDASGELARWSDADKLKLLSAMKEAGLVAQDERLEIAFDETRPLNERAAQAHALIAERYGDQYFDRHTIENIELPLAALDEEDQKAYTEWNEQSLAALYDPDAAHEGIDETRLYYETAKLLTASGNFPTEMIRKVDVSGEYKEEERRWVVTVSIDEALYNESMRDAARTTDFDSEKYSFKQDGRLCFRYFLDEGGYFLGKDDLSYTGLKERLTIEEAQKLAEEALMMRLNIESIDTLRALNVYASYSDSQVYDTEGGRFRTACTYLYRDAAGNGLYLVDIDALTGEVLTAVDYAAEQAQREAGLACVEEIRTLLAEAGVSGDLYNADREYFWHWTVDEKAAWSSVARPIVRKYINEHPDFKEYLLSEDALGEWDNLISLTQYAYGVPSAQAIPQAEAYRIAFDESLKMGANRRYLEDSQGVTYFYDVTDPARPLWKVRISVSFGASDYDHPYVDTMPIGYFTVIDALTGEIVHAMPWGISTDMKDVV